MIYAIVGFIVGFIIPYMARRFAKFMPATAAVAFWRLILPVKQVSWVKKYHNERYCCMCSAYFWRSCMFGIVSAILFYFSNDKFGPHGLTGILAFMWGVLLLFEIDYKTMLLPDIITIPLLIGGFLFACMEGVWISPLESALGAGVGYLLPVVASLFVAWKHPAAFGGGDIKFLAAIGAWVGMVCVVYVILLACILFAVFAAIKRRRAGAFGPAIATSAIIVAFYFL